MIINNKSQHVNTAFGSLREELMSVYYSGFSSKTLISAKSVSKNIQTKSQSKRHKK